MRLEIGRKRSQKGHKFDHASAVYTIVIIFVICFMFHFNSDFFCDFNIKEK